MDKIDIKNVMLTDIEQLGNICKQTFLETYSEVNTQENMKKYLNEDFKDDKLRSELTNPNSEFYFANFDNRVIGYLKLNFGQAQTELKDQNALEIERIYVLKEFQGKRIGQILYDKALQIAGRISADYVWLGVWEHNLRAINFYKKNGFVEFDKHIFKLGADDQMDIMMKLKLK